MVEAIFAGSFLLLALVALYFGVRFCQVDAELEAEEIAHENCEIYAEAVFSALEKTIKEREYWKQRAKASDTLHRAKSTKFLEVQLELQKFREKAMKDSLIQ